MTALLTDEEIIQQAHEKFQTLAERSAYVDGLLHARSIYEARLAEVSQLRDQYQGDLIKVNAALDGHANEIIRLSARLAEDAKVLAGLVEAMEPFAKFLRAVEAKPLRGADPETIYAIHTGTEWEAELKWQHLRNARAALSAAKEIK